MEKSQEEIEEKEVTVERVAYLDVVKLYTVLLSVSSNPSFKF